MGTRKDDTNRENMAEIAGARAKVYGLFAAIFSLLPDRQFLEGFLGDDVQHFLNACCELESAGFKPGVDRLNGYRAIVDTSPAGKVLEDLAIDRTGILRGTAHKDLKPPYEGLYRGRKNVGDSLLKIKRFYRMSGLVPEDSVTEPPDYLSVELDFMKQLCLRERDQWLSREETHETLAHQEAFLREHLGRWVKDFCRAVEAHARTDFYKGFAMILDAFILKETAYLRDRIQG
jgi:TorA maturation chaperone TorD